MQGDEQDCPKCGVEGALWRDSVDVGVGVMYGPWGCRNCGWSSDPAYDVSDGVTETPEGYRRDQYGSLHPPGCHCLLPGFDGCLMRVGA